MSAPKRFYETASVREAEGRFGVDLDARRLKTPKGAEFLVPKRALAEGVAAEWAAQGERIAHASMPLTRFSFTAIDHTAHNRPASISYVAKYAETDLICHRAEAPAALIARQAALWDPIHAWAREALGVSPPVVSGVIAAAVPSREIDALRHRAAALDDFHLTALAHGAGLAGSALIGFAMLDGALGAEDAFAAAALDDLWSLETWGEDAEARARLDRQRAEFDNIARYIGALG